MSGSGKVPAPDRRSRSGSLRAAEADRTSTRSSRRRSGTAARKARVTCHWWGSVHRMPGPASRRGAVNSSRCSTTSSGGRRRRRGASGLDRGAGGEEAVDVVDAPVEQGLPGVGPDRGRRCRQGAGRPGEAWRRGRLDDPVGLDPGPARPEVWVVGGLPVGQDGCDARVRALEDGGPLVPAAGGEDLGEPAPQLRPLARVAPVRQRWRRGVVETEPPDELAQKRSSSGTDRQPLAVARRVDVVEGRAAVEQVGAARLGPEAAVDEPDEEGGQRAVPSTMAASTTWPRPLDRASSRAARTPTTR